MSSQSLEVQTITSGCTKIIKDCIYGHIMIPSLCVTFMDVPEFQRLRRVRQLGMAHYAYPSAVHTRFEHSLGVMHLAGRMVDQLRKYVTISDRTKELIQLAGMYHDIGHFAYSHLFDAFLSRTKLPAEVDPIFQHKDHEDRSLAFLANVNARLKLLSSEEEQFVANVISGHVPEGEPAYLYQIICNEECKIDVDRQDYLRRDSYHTGFPGFQSDYIMMNSIVDATGNLAYKKKVYNDLSDLYEARRRMFGNVYQHHTSQKLDKIYFCMMKRLGTKLFTYGAQTDDYNIETMFRTSEETRELIAAIDNRELGHECNICKEYHSSKHIKASGTIDQVRFI